MINFQSFVNLEILVNHREFSCAGVMVVVIYQKYHNKTLFFEKLFTIFITSYNQFYTALFRYFDIIIVIFFWYKQVCIRISHWNFGKHTKDDISLIGIQFPAFWHYFYSKIFINKKVRFEKVVFAISEKKLFFPRFNTPTGAN